MPNVIACVDAHVHLHQGYAPDALLQNAYDDLSAAAGNGADRAAPRAYFLLFAECAPDDCFGALHTIAQGGANGSSGLRLRRWTVAPTQEPISVVARLGQR